MSSSIFIQTLSSPRPAAVAKIQGDSGVIEVFAFKQ